MEVFLIMIFSFIVLIMAVFIFYIIKDTINSYKKKNKKELKFNKYRYNNFK